MWVDERGRECLDAMLGLSAMSRWRFTPEQAESLRRDVYIVCRGSRQMVGACVRDKAEVREEELDGAVLRILCNVACLVRSGALDSLAGAFEAEGPSA